MTSEPVIAGIGESLGRGTVISIIMVMFVLPQILLIGSKVIDRTSFAVPNVIHRHAAARHASGSTAWCTARSTARSAAWSARSWTAM